MKIMIELDSTAGAVKVTIPTSAEGEVAAQPTVQPAALDAGASRAGVGEGPSAERAVVTQTAAQSAVQGAAQNAGAYGGIAPGEGPSAVRPQSTNASSSAATESTPTPIIVDDFGSHPGISRSDLLDAGSPKG